MSNPVKTRVLVVGLVCVLTIGLATAVSDGAPKPKAGSSYIEIYDGRISYVPRSAEYVKINGQVRKIIKFAATLSNDEKDCKCPQCCNGSCYVIVFTDSILLNRPIVVLAIIWVSCA